MDNLPDVPKLNPLWRRAASYAARVHQGQFRRDGTTPYFAHTARVAMIVRDVFACDDPEIIAAAYLHDTIEDTGTDFEDIQSLVGPRAAAMVAALTKDMRLPEPQREPQYDAQLADADYGARIIKLADTYDNVLDCEPNGPKLRKALDKAKRAVTLAEQDSDAASVRAVQMVHALIDARSAHA